MVLCGPQEGSLGLEGQWAWVPVAVVRGGALQGESQKGVGRLLLLDRAMLIITPDCEPSLALALKDTGCPGGGSAGNTLASCFRSACMWSCVHYTRTHFQ